MAYLLGVDVGSFSTKGTLLSTEGNVIATAVHKHIMQVPKPGHAEHDAIADWWGGFVNVTQQLLQKSGINATDIQAIGCSGIAPAVLPLDKDHQPLCQAILYGIDARAEAEIRELQQEWGIDAVLARCGNPITTQSIAPKIRWLQKHKPDIYAKTQHIVGCTTYLVQRLTGRFVVDHYCAASSTVYDVHQLNWAKDFISSVCPVEWMPDLAWSSDIAGYVTAEAAQLTGLAEGTAVIVGTADAAAEGLSVGLSSAGDLMVMYGTTVFFIQVTPQLHVDQRHWSVPFLFPDTYCISGGLAASGALTHWFRAEMADLPDTSESFQQLEALASRSPAGANGLITLPYFSGERTPLNDPLAKGMLFGLNLTHTRGDIYRSLLEGISHAIAHNLSVFSAASPINRIFAIGGGVHNATWLQATSDIAQVEQIVSRESVGASLGDAMMAGLGSGVFTLDDLSSMNPVARIVKPRSEFQALYHHHHQLYQQLYQNNKVLMHQL